ncbi:HpcH/HpaI aldolase family protein [Pedococcus sp. 5OH_020]|uniref:HpcH/HpaI aldolase family protein n=1 Tax=Pedococcus sp. 5OH_020 TaxID=2989814 RepID=UPI0022EA0129|nr:aldolase/citrate lyase family protein [Pedococcus sp. 5OH_020]
MSNDTAPLLRNYAKEKLAAGQPVYSMTVRLVRSIDIASIAYTAGFDSVYIDLEHSGFPLDALSQICMACNHLGVTPLVRVPGLDAALIGRVMDIGAMGVILPGVESADEARAAVDAAKHAPLGKRSLAGAATQLHYRPLPPAQTVRELDDASMVVAMIESQTGLAAADEIAAVPGVDMLLVGANDLSVELGVAGQMDDPGIDKAYLHVLDVCRTHGKAVGIGGLGGRPDLIRKYLQLGAQYVSTGNDISFLLAAATEKRRQFDS